MIRKPVTIQNNMDMEDRPVAHLVQEASALKWLEGIIQHDRKQASTRARYTF